MEMILVIAVVSFLLAMAAPNLFSIMRSSELGSQGDIFRSRLSLAQQTALSTNADVEVRFFKFADLANEETEEEFRAIQFYQYNEEGDLKPISEIFRLNPPLVFSDNSKYSNLLTDSNINKGTVSASDEDSNVTKIFGRGVKNATYRSFRFRPDGSTSLVSIPSGDDGAEITARTWFVTLVEGQFTGAADAIGEERPNFFTVQIDPYNGSLREFRP